MKLDRIVKWGFLAALALAGLAIWAFSADEHDSKHEHDWRLKTSPSFQADFPTGAGK